jgi:hypothetical protein
MRISFFVIIVVFCCSSVVMSQTSADSIAAMYIDFSPPDLAAFTLLGVNSNAVTRPGNLKELSAAFLNTASINGKITPGIAVEWSPFQTLGSSSLAEYREATFLRNVQMSFATAQDSSATNVAFGIRWVPIDFSDPLNDPELNQEVNSGLAYFDFSSFAATKRKAYQDQVRNFFIRLEPNGAKAFNMIRELDPVRLDSVRISVDSLVEEIVATRKAQGGAQFSATELQNIRALAALGLAFRGTADVAGDVNRLIEDARNRFKDRTWNATVVQLSVGTIWNSPTSSWNALRSDRLSAFGGGSFRLGSFGEWIAQIQYTSWYGDTANEKWSYSVGTRFLAGSSDLHGTVEALYASTKRINPQPDDQTLRYTLGIETKLSEGLWLEIAMGALTPQGSGSHPGMISLANLKYAFGKQSKFNIP